NDEDWGLVPWAAKTHEPDVGNLGPKTYSKLFELMLRLRANTLWPGMHPTTTPFFKVPGNAAAADRYAIILGSSHAEPMLRNNVGEWTASKDDYNYVKNPAGVLAYWKQRVKERTSGESLFTLGMRGIHDSAIVGPKSQPERIATVETIIADQRALLARHLGKGDPTRVGQIFVPYKEVLEDYNAGLKIPDDVALVWPDDNFGYIRRFGTSAEQKRRGGLGVYYHASYLGAPLPWLWLDTLPPALVWTEMTKAYEHGARTVWIVNVGDLKNTERSTEFFLDLAWHAARTSPDAPSQFLAATAARDFGAPNASAIASILARHQALAFARKPEHLSWSLPKTPYQPTPLTDTEIHTRLADYATLLRDTETVAAALPANAQDAFFELVAYPVASAAAANERYFKAELARRLKVRGDEPAARAAFADSEAAALRITELTRRYNEDIAGGKWRGIVMVNGLSKRDWPSFQLPPVLPLDDAPALSAVTTQESTLRPPSSVLRPPSSARSGDFIETAGLVSLHAGHFTSQTDIPGGGWRSIPGLGRTGSAVTVLPSTLQGSPRLSYRFHLSTGGPATLRVRLLPTHPLVSGQGLRFAIALDDGQPITLAVKTGFDPKSSAWKDRVLSNVTEVSLALPALTPGAHTLHLVAVDAGVVIDKFVIDLGGLTPSYDGPSETRVP
ncbi:MAG: glycosyl hydrolase 115 family protein, partial [Rariglobus sp.]